jgi:hypothetical protein
MTSSLESKANKINISTYGSKKHVNSLDGGRDNRNHKKRREVSGNRCVCDSQNFVQSK